MAAEAAHLGLSNLPRFPAHALGLLGWPPALQVFGLLPTLDLVLPPAPLQTNPNLAAQPAAMAERCVCVALDHSDASQRALHWAANKLVNSGDEVRQRPHPLCPSRPLGLASTPVL